MAVLVFSVIFRVPAVQTWAVKKVLEKVDTAIPGKVSISEVYFVPVSALLIKDVVIQDDLAHACDTVVHINSVYATFSVRELLEGHGLHLSKATLDRPLVNIRQQDGVLNIVRALGLQTDGNESSFDLFGIHAGKISLKKGRVLYSDGNGTDLDLNVNANISSIRYKDGNFSAKLRDISATDADGTGISSLEADFSFSDQTISVGNLELHDSWSAIHAPDLTYSLATNSYSGNIEGTIIRSETLDSILPLFTDWQGGKSFDILLSAEGIEGDMDNISFSSLSVSESSSGIRARLAGWARGISDIENMTFGVNLNQLSFTTRGLSSLLGQFVPSAAQALRGKGEGEVFSVTGSARGSLKDMSCKLDMSGTSSGSLALDAKLSDVLALADKGRISGSIQTHRLDVGRLAGIDALGRLSLSSDMNAKLGSNPYGKINMLEISSIEVLEKAYGGIVARAELENGNANVSLKSTDSKLLAEARANAKLPDKDGRMHVDLDAVFEKIGLSEMGLLKSDSTSASFTLAASLDQVKSDTDADITLSNIHLSDRRESRNIGDIMAGYLQTDDECRASLTSAFLDATYKGSGTFPEFIDDLLNATVNKELPSLTQKVSEDADRHGYHFRADFHDSMELLGFVAPGAFIADSTWVDLSLQPGGKLLARGHSNRIAFMDKYVKGMELNVDNLDESLSGVIRGQEIQLGGIYLENDEVIVYANDDRFGLSYRFQNSDEQSNFANVDLYGELLRDAEGKLSTTISTLPSNVSLDGRSWTIHPSEVHVYDGNINVDGLLIDSEDQSFSLQGGVSMSQTDTLSLELNSFDISFVNNLTDLGLDLRSQVTGKVYLMSPVSDNRMGILANLTGENTYIAGNDMGSLRAAATMDQASKKLVMVAKDVVDGVTAADLRATYLFADNSIDAQGRFQHFNLGTIAPVLDSFADEFGGYLDGTVNAEGPLDALKINSRGLKVSDGVIKIEFTQVPYQFNGPLHLTRDGLYFDNIRLNDKADGSGTLSGSVNFDDNWDIGLGIHLALQNMEAIDLDASQSVDFFGNAFASGTLDVTGNASDISLVIDAVTSKAGNIHIPVYGATDQQTSNLLTFKEEEKVVYIDPYELMMSKGFESKSAENLRARVSLDVRPVVNLHIDIDNNGSSIVANGSGNVIIDYRSTDEYFGLGGDFTVNEGNGHISVMGLASRDFTIQNGGTIQFNGDPMETELNLSATYSTKASLGTLISEDSATRRTVNCNIALTDKLKNPNTEFSIDIPDLNPSTKSHVDSALSTDDKVQKQFIALLLTGSFLPDEQSGIISSAATTTGTLYSSIGSLMANGVNNIMQKLDIPLDLGLNYQATEGGTNIFDVALSTQLWDNRISVSGNVGNRQYGATTSDNGDFIGNLDIEIKVDKTGERRVSLFSHAADEYTNFLDDSQRNGAGLVYQKEFSSFRQFFKGLFKRFREEEQTREESETVTINIE